MSEQVDEEWESLIHLAKMMGSGQAYQLARHCEELRDEMKMVEERLKNLEIDFKSLSLTRTPEDYEGL